MIPNYVEIINMGMNNTLIAMILPHCCSVFANISMYQNFNSMPKALIDAAAHGWQQRTADFKRYRHAEYEIKYCLSWHCTCHHSME